MKILRCPRCSLQVIEEGQYAVRWFRAHVWAVYVACSACGDNVLHERFVEHMKGCPSYSRLTTGANPSTSTAKCWPTTQPIHVIPPKNAPPRPKVSPRAAPAKQILPDIPVERLSFRMLPPGTWGLQDVVDHYLRQRSQLSAAQAEGFDESRVRLIFQFLKPLKCYVGEELWFGYVLFEFGNSTSLLEHPFHGNAVYVLCGDWMEMIHRTKAEIRSEFSTRYIKVNHVGD